MKAIIPVAGLGTRLKPFSLAHQKCLFPVGGKPVLEHILEKLVYTDIKTIDLVIGHLGEQVKEFCTNYSNFEFNFIEQQKQLGLAHAINYSLVESTEPVLIILGDAILNLNYNKLLSSSNSTLGIYKVKEPKRFGIVELNNKQIINLVEKPEVPPSNYALIGIYYISSEKKLKNSINYIIENNIKTKGEYQLTDAIKNMLDNGSILNSFEVKECLDCGTIESILRTNYEILTSEKSNYIDSSAIIKESIINNSTISKDCTVINSKLSNVIMLSGSSVENTSLNNAIIDNNNIVEYNIDKYL